MPGNNEKDEEAGWQCPVRVNHHGEMFWCISFNGHSGGCFMDAMPQSEIDREKALR